MGSTKSIITDIISVKYICLFLFGWLFCLVPAHAQTWDEIFNQKKTQLKYLGDQIIALQMYAGYVKKGYDVVGEGLNTVKDLKNGEFGLHNLYISSFKLVNPNIRNSSKVAEIINMQISINKIFSVLPKNEYLTANDLLYISNVKSEVKKDCNQDLEELLLVITSGKVEMKDDERIKRLNKVYNNMEQKSAFTQSFSNEVGLLVNQRRSDQNDINTNKRLFGIN